jgi:hypothetical protein
MKEKVIEIINRKAQEAISEIQALEEVPSSDAEKEELRAQLLAANEKVSLLEAKLLEVDAAVKAVDALVPDQVPQA